MSGLLIIAEHRRGELRPVTFELVTAAQAARRGPSDKVTVAVIADDLRKFVPFQLKEFVERKAERDQ